MVFYAGLLLDERQARLGFPRSPHRTAGNLVRKELAARAVPASAAPLRSATRSNGNRNRRCSGELFRERASRNSATSWHTSLSPISRLRLQSATGISIRPSDCVGASQVNGIFLHHESTKGRKHEKSAGAECRDSQILRLIPVPRLLCGGNVKSRRFLARSPSSSRCRVPMRAAGTQQLRIRSDCRASFPPHSGLYSRRLSCYPAKRAREARLELPFLSVIYSERELGLSRARGPFFRNPAPSLRPHGCG